MKYENCWQNLKSYVSTSLLCIIVLRLRRLPRKPLLCVICNIDTVRRRQIGDKTGEAAAQMNLTDIRRSLGLPLDCDPIDDYTDHSSVRRKSMEKMDLLKVTL